MMIIIRMCKQDDATGDDRKQMKDETKDQRTILTFVVFPAPLFVRSIHLFRAVSSSIIRIQDHLGGTQSFE